MAYAATSGETRARNRHSPGGRLSADSAQHLVKKYARTFLGSELARESRGVKDSATAGFIKLIESIAQKLTGRSPAAAKEEADVIVSTMIGAMTVARLITDSDLAVSVLTQARKSVLESVRPTDNSA